MGQALFCLISVLNFSVVPGRPFKRLHISSPKTPYGYIESLTLLTHSNLLHAISGKQGPCDQADALQHVARPRLSQ